MKGGNLAEKTIFILVLIMSVLLVSCDSSTESLKDPKMTNHYMETTIVHQAGFSWADEEISFLPSPFNIGEHKGRNVILLCDALPIGELLLTKPVGVIRIDEKSVVRNYILAVPVSEKYKSMSINSFSDLITEQSSVKWMIEYYLLSRNGLGSAKLVAWEDEHYVSKVILNKK